MQGYYHVSQVCLNGHELTDRIDENPEKESRCCPTCGERTIFACLHCASPIRGEYESLGFDPDYGRGTTPVPNYCHACGNPYPWTNRHKETARKMVDDLPRLSKKEKEVLKDCIDDLVDDTPEATYSASKFDELMKKTKKKAGNQLREFLIEVVAETAKRMSSP